MVSECIILNPIILHTLGENIIPVHCISIPLFKLPVSPNIDQIYSHCYTKCLMKKFLRQIDATATVHSVFLCFYCVNFFGYRISAPRFLVNRFGPIFSSIRFQTPAEKNPRSLNVSLTFLRHFTDLSIAILMIRWGDSNHFH